MADSCVVISAVAVFLVYFLQHLLGQGKPVVDKALAEKLATGSHDENCVSLKARGVSSNSITFAV